MGVTNPSLIGLLLVGRDVFFILSPSLLVGDYVSCRVGL